VEALLPRSLLVGAAGEFIDDDDLPFLHDVVLSEMECVFGVEGVFHVEMPGAHEGVPGDVGEVVDGLFSRFREAGVASSGIEEVSLVFLEGEGRFPRGFVGDGSDRSPAAAWAMTRGRRPRR
jgi:hypothetical protein